MIKEDRMTLINHLIGSITFLQHDYASSHPRHVLSNNAIHFLNSLYVLEESGEGEKFEEETQNLQKKHLRILGVDEKEKS